MYGNVFYNLARFGLFATRKIVESVEAGRPAREYDKGLLEIGAGLRKAREREAEVLPHLWLLAPLTMPNARELNQTLGDLRKMRDLRDSGAWFTAKAAAAIDGWFDKFEAAIYGGLPPGASFEQASTQIRNCKRRCSNVSLAVLYECALVAAQAQLAARAAYDKAPRGPLASKAMDSLSDAARHASFTKREFDQYRITCGA